MLMCTTAEKAEILQQVEAIERLVTLCRDETNDPSIRGKLSATLGHLVLLDVALVQVA